MTIPGPGPCSMCGCKVTRADFEAERAMLLLGKICCIPCLESRSLFCHPCRKQLSRKDFDSGRAVTLLGNRYCDVCLVHALLKQRNRHPRPAARPEPKPEPVLRETAPVRPETRRIPLAHLEDGQDSRRAFSRFIPPAECSLSLKPEGLRGLFSSNLVKIWVDVSEGGLRAVVSGSFRKDDPLRGEVVYPPLKARHEIRVVVRYAKPCTAYPGCTMVGVQFQNPTADLQAFIREVLAETPSIALETGRRVKPETKVRPA
ncbi:MAG: PilZ domain-containing protein [Planctomycetes bacterium]|nr:PilZ domain-containing protein [Planctomycetota bacterium]